MTLRLLTVGQAARETGVPRSTLYCWLRTGRLGGVKLGNARIRIPEAALRALIEAAMPDTGRPGAEGE